MSTYVITGATGHIGNIVSRELLAQGHHVRAIARNADKLKSLTELGAEAVTGNTTDPDFLKNAFRGADAVFCLLMPDMFAADVRKAQDQIAENFYEAVRACRVPHVVLLSSVGAHLRNGAGIVDGLGYMEELFLKLEGTNVLNLRPTYFMENTFGLIGMIKQMGIAGGPIRPEISFPIVATKDIGAVAAKRLLALDFKGNETEYVLGARDISYAEITSIVGNAIGKPDLAYIQFPYEDAAKGMTAAGFCGDDAARLMVDLAKAINDGTLLNAHHRTSANTTPTTYEEFAHIFAAVYNM
jgi:uncharacterized protein YbjT (DUF2867 family)